MQEKLGGPLEKRVWRRTGQDKLYVGGMAGFRLSLMRLSVFTLGHDAIPS